MLRSVAAALLLVAAGQAWWEPDVRLTWATGGSYTSRNNARSVCTAGDTVHAAWYDRRDGNRELYYKRSTDGGAAWGEDRRLTEETATSRTPSLAAAGPDVHVVWYDERDGRREVYYKRSTDAGMSWSADLRLTWSGANSYNPSLAADGGILHLVWMRDSSSAYPEVYYRRSTDRGVGWDAEVRLTSDTQRSYNPAVAADSCVHVVWSDFRDRNWEVYYRRSADHGQTWEPEIRLTDDAAASEDPCVAAFESLVHVVWYDERDGNQEVYYRRSCDRGQTWEPEIRLTDAEFSSSGASVASADTKVHVVWMDLRSGSKEVYYRRSVDGGASWQPEERLTEDSAESNNPCVAAGGDKVHVVWHDMRTGGNEVYYKRNPNGNTGLEERRPEDEAGRTAGRNGPNPDMDVDRTGWLYDAAGRRRPPGRLPAGVYLAVGRVRIVVHGP